MIRLLNAIYKLGKLYLEKEGLNEFEVLLDNKNIGAVLSIDLIEDDFGNFSYDKVSQEETLLKSYFSILIDWRIL